MQVDNYKFYGGFIVADIKYKRIVFKLSGESLAGEQRFGINPEVVESIAKQIKKYVNMVLK